MHETVTNTKHRMFTKHIFCDFTMLSFGTYPLNMTRDRESLELMALATRPFARGGALRGVPNTIGSDDLSTRSSQPPTPAEPADEQARTRAPQRDANRGFHLGKNDRTWDLAVHAQVQVRFVSTLKLGEQQYR